MDEVAVEDDAKNLTLKSITFGLNTITCFQQKDKNLDTQFSIHSAMK